MQIVSQNRAHVRRLVFDAMLVALFVVFSTVLSFKTPWFEVSLVSLPILLCAYFYGWADALAVAALGSFVEQLTSQYGLSPTTPVWMAPVMLLALVASLGFFLAKKAKNPAWIVLAIVVAELVLTFANTAALYLDGYIWQYPVKALHLLLPTRLINGGVRTVISCILLPLLLRPLSRVLARR